MKQAKREVATFAGGCFWCLQEPFDILKGVIRTTVGYMGGHVKLPTYEEVSSGTTGHAEVIQVEYDPEVVSYQKLVQIFLHNIDPTASNRQFCDIGSQYRTAIFFHNEQQKKIAEAARKELENSGKFHSIATEIVSAGTFFPADESHQEYYKKNPERYQSYHHNSGREEYIKRVWK